MRSLTRPFLGFIILQFFCPLLRLQKGQSVFIAAPVVSTTKTFRLRSIFHGDGFVVAIICCVFVSVVGLGTYGKVFKEILTSSVSAYLNIFALVEDREL